MQRCYDFQMRRFGAQAVIVVWASGLLFGCNKNKDSDPPPQVTPADNTPPTAPSNLTASVVSGTRIDLAWTASTDVGGSGVASYRIFRNGGASSLGTATTSNYSDPAVVGGTTYTYRVTAVDQAGNISAASNIATATTPGTPPVTGLDVRPSNTNCIAWNRPTAGNSISLARMFANLPNFSFPIAMLQAPGNSSRWYVVEQNGFVRVFDNVAAPAAPTTFIDIDSRVAGVGGSEMGLLGMAFHPNYPADPRVFLSYTAAAALPLAAVSRISSFRSTDGGATLDPASEQILLTVEQPQSNHNGGNIAFGPDGFLYIGFGDGGNSDDVGVGHLEPFGNGQRLTTMLGKILRIDVGPPLPGNSYSIPNTNPFASGNTACPAAGRASGNCPEIYAYGFRNPWRWSFDRLNGDLWVGDVGQRLYEEVDRVVLGGNYGWRCREGANPFNSNCGGATNTIDPVAEYGRTLGASITGGYVYRGTQSTTLLGSYIFGDYVTGNIFSYTPGSSSLAPRVLMDTPFNISSFGQDTSGELYVVNYSGTLHRIVFQAGTGGGIVPDSLADTNCVVRANPTQPASGLIPYGINAPFWSDGASKERFIGLPNGTAINVEADGDWNFPNGTVLVKNFRIDNQLIETRLFMRHLDDGSWGGYTYAWNPSQTAATRVEGGDVRTMAGQTWIFPAESQCIQCHTAAAGHALGLETAQLNGNFDYPSPGRTANQLATHSFIGTVSPTYPANVQSLLTMPDPANTSADLTLRARAYLHTNCSQCHRPGSGIASMDLRYGTALTATNLCSAPPATPLIVPGDAANSLLINRINHRRAGSMPPLGSAFTDNAGVTLVTQWINALTGC